jgi:hypothetical protein
MTIRFVIGISSLLIGLLFVHTAVAATVTLELSAGDVACDNVVVESELPPPLADHEHFTLTRIGTGESIPVQLDRNSSDPKLVWIVRDKLDAGSRR